MKENYSVIEQHIAKVVHDLEQSGADIIAPDYVAGQVDKLIDPMNTAPGVKTYAAIMYIRDKVRKHLAKNHDPVERVKQTNDDMFGADLQEYYPVKREVDGEKARVYVARGLLSESEKDAIELMLSKAIRGLQAHLHSFQAWRKSKADTA